MAQRLHIFIDDGGVINDNTRRAVQWRRLLGEFFVPLLGGTPEAWIEANRTLTDHLFNAENWNARLQAATDYTSFDRTYLVDWLGGMCELMGLPSPPEEECIELGHRASAFIIPRIDAAFPGAADAIRTLHHQGYILHTASGESSSELAAYLEGIGVRACFDRLYGPDLIETFKQGPAYYERIFADSGVAPADALVIDDSPHVLTWASHVGAATVLVGNAASPGRGPTKRIGSLAELPTILP